MFPPTFNVTVSGKSEVCSGKKKSSSNNSATGDDYCSTCCRWHLVDLKFIRLLLVLQA